LNLERGTGLEPATTCLEGRSSTRLSYPRSVELHSSMTMKGQPETVPGEGVRAVPSFTVVALPKEKEGGTTKAVAPPGVTSPRSH
jgi:hypothetical protein